ncbi:hypothetical protein Gotur_028606, partial [Gossypium turneri]
MVHVAQLAVAAESFVSKIRGRAVIDGDSYFGTVTILPRLGTRRLPKGLIAPNL